MIRQVRSWAAGLEPLQDVAAMPETSPGSDSAGDSEPCNPLEALDLESGERLHSIELQDMIGEVGMWGRKGSIACLATRGASRFSATLFFGGRRSHVVSYPGVRAMG